MSALAFLTELLQGKPAGYPACVWSKGAGSRWPLTAEDAARAVPTLGDDPYIAVSFLAPGAGAELGRHKRTSNATAAGIYGLWLDIDVKPGCAPDLDEAETLAWTFMEPTMVVATGGGLHAWHLFREPWVFADDDDRRRAGDLAERWLGAHRHAAGWGIDPCADLARVLRIPGTVNTKHDKRVELLDDGMRPARQHDGEPYCAIGLRHSVDDLAAAVAHVPVAPKAPMSAPATGDATAIPKGRRDNTLTSMAGSLRNLGLEEDEIAAALLAMNANRCDPPLPSGDVARIARSVARYEPAEDEPVEEHDDALRNIPAAEYIPWLAPDGCPQCGAALRAFKHTAWFCGACPPRRGAGKRRLGGGIYQLAGLVAGHDLPLSDGAFSFLREFLVEEWATRLETGA